MATDLDLQYILSADSSKLSTGMASAGATVDAATAGMAAATKTLEASTTTSTIGIGTAFKAMAASVMGANASIAESSTAAAASVSGGFRNAATGLTSSMGGINTAFNLVKNNLLLLSGVLAGGAAFKESIDATNKWNGDAMKLSKQLGISTQEASGYMVAMHKFGIESDTLGTAVQKISIQLMKGGQGFKTLGIDVKDATGQFRPAMDIINETNSKIKEIHNPILQAQAGIAAYGKSWADIKPMMKLTGEEIEKAKEKMKLLNLEVSPEQAANSKKYKEAMSDFKLAIQAIAINIGQAVLPAFSQLAMILAEVAITIVSWLRPAFDLISAAFSQIVPIVKGFWSVLSTLATDIKDVFAATFHSVFGESLPKDIDYLAGVINAFKTFFIGFKIGMLEVFEAIRLAINLLKNSFVTFAAVAGAAIHLDWAGAKAAVAAGVHGVEDEVSGSMGRIAKIAQDGAKELSDVWSGLKSPKKEDKSKQELDDPDLDFGKAKKESMLKAFASELAIRKEHFETTNALDGHYIEFSKQQEEAFWIEKLKLVAKGTDDYRAIEMKIALDRIAIAKQAFDVEMATLQNNIAEYKNNTDKKLEYANQYLEKIRIAYGKESTQYLAAQKEITAIKQQSVEQQKQIDATRIQSAQEHNLAIIAAESDVSKLRQAMGLQDNAASLQNEALFENRIFAIKQQGLSDELELARSNPDRNPVEIAKINAQLEALEIEHQTKLRTIQHAATIDRNKDTLSITSSFQSGMAGAIKAVASGTSTIAGAMRSFMLSMLDAVVGILANMAAAWATQKLTEMILGKAAAVSGVAGNAAIAGAAATASAAAIPIVGWAMAPAAGAAAFSAAMSFGAVIPAAAQGYDIPAGVNPLTQLHEKEMVLPAAQAQVIRDMSNGGGSAGANITIHAVDAAGVKKLFMDHGSSLVAALAKQNRNFKSGK